MRRIKLWRKLTALTLSAALLVPVPAISASEGLEVQGEETGERAGVPQSQSVETDGFVIAADGSLRGYEGNATDVVIPDTVTSIFNWAFKNCSSLERIEILESVTDIGEGAFNNCINLKNIKLPGSLTVIKEAVFSNCSSLNNIKIPESVTEIRENAFAGCCSLKSVELSKNLTNIGGQAFMDCSSLSDIEIPEKVTSIGVYAFSNCSSLSDIKIPESVTTIGETAFYECKNLNSIEIPESVTSIGNNAFLYCDNLTIYGKTGSCAWEYAEENGIAFLDRNMLDPAESGFIIKDGSLEKYEGNATDVVIPDVVTSISNYAFKDCSNLRSITIPKSVRYISYCAFEGCSNLSEIIVSEENLYYTSENGCLYNDEKTKVKAWPGAKGNIEIPESVTEISERAFVGCSGLESIEIPENVTYIGEHAFYNCRNLNSVKLPENLTMIRDGVFSSCSSLESIEIPESVTSIGENAFRQCSSLKSVRIPKNLTSIAVYAFEGCSSLETVEILGNETSIGATVFWHCSNLSTIDVSADNLYHTSENGCLYNKDRTKIIAWPAAKGAVKISEKVTYISDYAFSSYKNLIIYGKAGSYAETYAKENNIPFVAEGGQNPGLDPDPAPSPNPNPPPIPDPAPTPQPAPKKAISSCEIKLSQTSYTYDGKAKTPAVTVKDGTRILKAGTDYNLSYKNNIKAGTAKVILTGKGNYSGTAERTFTIKETEKGTQTIRYKKSYDKTYGDKPFSLNAKVTKGNGTLTYKSSNKKAATVDSKGRVTIKGTGIAEITVKAEATSKYREKSIKVTVKVKPAKQMVKSLKVQKGEKLKVTWKKDKNADGYEIQYSTDKKFKSKGMTKLTRINSRTVFSKTLAKLKKGKKYYVRVRAFKNVKEKGKTQKLYGSWSDIKRSENIKK